MINGLIGVENQLRLLCNLSRASIRHEFIYMPWGRTLRKVKDTTERSPAEVCFFFQIL